jgi:hypothetical protein
MPAKWVFVGGLGLLLAFHSPLIANQDLNPDSASVMDPVHPTRWGRPQTAAALSAVVPGAGQFYNREYWKIPLVYGLIGATGYFLYTQQAQTTHYALALDYRLDNDPLTIDPYVGQYTPTQLLSLKNTARRSRDYAALGMLAAWGFQVLDAHVGGHLYSFDVSRNLELQARVSPADWGAGIGVHIQLLPQTSRTAP